MIILRTADLALIAAITCLICALKSQNPDRPAAQPIKIQPASWHETAPVEQAEPSPVTGWF
ncbi:MAG: hypothetical protein ACON5H_08600 [Akkermansiaceae bacterium]